MKKLWLQKSNISNKWTNIRYFQNFQWYIDGLVQERRNCIANSLGLNRSCTNLTKCEVVHLTRPVADTRPWIPPWEIGLPVTQPAAFRSKWPANSTWKCHEALTVCPVPRLNIKQSFPGMGIPMSKTRQSRDCLILNMGIPISVRRHLYIQMGPWVLRSELLPHLTLWSLKLSRAI